MENDSLTQAGAESLAYRLRQFWRDKGYAITTRVEARAPKPTDGAKAFAFFQVRSNLVNGLPPEDCRIVPPVKEAA
jgi:hypothetical protein